MKKQTIWRLLAKSLGEKTGKNNTEADKIAVIRLLMFLSIFVTNCFIVAGVVRHWDDDQPIIIIEKDVSSSLFQTQEERLLKTNRNLEYD